MKKENIKISLVFNPNDCKLIVESYSQTYRDQWLAIGKRFKDIQPITEDCSAEDIEGDIIVFYDPHSSHHIKIDGLERHSAIKYEYMDDPYQLDWAGQHKVTGEPVLKLGFKNRIERALNRGIDYIICPYTELYFRFFGKLLDSPEKKLLWFPPCPDIDRYKLTPYGQRKPEVLANGSIGHLQDFKGYEFRKWAFEQSEVSLVKHCIIDKATPRGFDYPKLLLDYMGALALCDTHIPPKYIEIPMAGCVCFAQYQKDYERMGFVDYENCIYVTKKNFSEVMNEFKKDPMKYKYIADAGRNLIEKKWTADNFADFIYRHAENELK